jgi:hypothetical protein
MTSSYDTKVEKLVFTAGYEGTRSTTRNSIEKQEIWAILQQPQRRPFLLLMYHGLRGNSCWLGHTYGHARNDGGDDDFWA